jgi:hypothetical protein
LPSYYHFTILLVGLADESKQRSTTEMSTSATVTTGETTEQAVAIRAHGAVVKRLGHWTDRREFDVRTSRGTVVMDLRSTQIPAGDITISLDADHAIVKLLVSDGVVVEDGDVRRVGRGRVKDWTGTAAADGRRIVLTGELRHAEVRVHRGGIAILSAMCSREYLTDARQARREGRFPTIDDPSR